MKKIIITGANSFISKKAADLLKKKNFYIIGISSSTKDIKNFDEIFNFRLGESIQDIFNNNDIYGIIHCAYDKRNIDNSINTKGTIKWAEEAEDYQVKLQVFLSSVSAFKESISSYGQSKYKLEKWFKNKNYIVFRLGLVFGNGGIFKNLVSLVRKYPFFPLIHRGKTLTHISDLNTVANILCDTISGEVKNINGKAFNLHQQNTHFLRDIILEIKKQLNTTCIMVPVPYVPVYAFIKFLELLKLNFGVSSNNLKGVKQNSKIKLESHIKQLGYNEVDLKKLIKKYL